VEFYTLQVILEMSISRQSIGLARTKKENIKNQTSKQEKHQL